MHVKIPAGAPRIVEFEIPFVDPRSLLETQPVVDLEVVRTMGTVTLSVFNQMRIGAGASQLSIPYSVFVSFPRPDFQIIRSALDPDDEEKFEYVSQGGRQSLAKSPVNVQDVGPQKTHKPVQNVNGVTNLLAGWSDLATVAAIEEVRVLDARVESSFTRVREIGTPIDETTFAHLMRPTFYGTTELRAGNGFGDTLIGGSLCPFPSTMSFGIGDPFVVTSMEYATLPFNFWKGDLIFEFEIVATPFHSARLAFFPLYGTTLVPSSISGALSQYAMIMDVGASVSTFRFVVPWKSDREMLRVLHGPFSGGAGDYVLGGWGLKVINTLQYAETVSDSVEINVYLGMENFELDFPGSGMNFYTVPSPYEPLGDEAQASARAA